MATIRQPDFIKMTIQFLIGTYTLNHYVVIMFGYLQKIFYQSILLVVYAISLLLLIM